MKRDDKNASLTIDDLRSRLLSHSENKVAKFPGEKNVSDDKRALSRELKQYIMALVCGIVVALLIIGFLD